MKKYSDEELEILKRTNASEWKLVTSIFFVEANSNEQFNLWKENRDEKIYKWEEDSMGFWQIIGNINNDESMPVTVAFSFAVLDGQRICFYDATSRYVDHNMIEEFIEKNYPVRYDSGHRRAMTNATNFHHVSSAIKEHNERKTKKKIRQK